MKWDLCYIILVYNKLSFSFWHDAYFYFFVYVSSLMGLTVRSFLLSDSCHHTIGMFIVKSRFPTRLRRSWCCAYLHWMFGGTDLLNQPLIGCECRHDEGLDLIGIAMFRGLPVSSFGGWELGPGMVHGVIWDGLRSIRLVTSLCLRWSCGTDVGWRREGSGP